MTTRWLLEACNLTSRQYLKHTVGMHADLSVNVCVRVWSRLCYVHTTCVSVGVTHNNVHYFSIELIQNRRKFQIFLYESIMHR